MFDVHVLFRLLPRHPHACIPWLLPLILALIFSLVSCSTPIGVRKVGMRKAYQEIHSNVLNGKEISDDTKIVLYRFSLLEQLIDN